VKQGNEKCGKVLQTLKVEIKLREDTASMLWSLLI